MTAELRTYITSRPAWEFRLWFGCLAVAFGIIALAAIPVALWGWLLGVVTLATCAGLAAWGWELKRELAAANKYATGAQTSAANAVTLAETFASECRAIHAANEVLCAELAAADEKLARLSGDNVISLPVVREPSPYDWPTNTDDALWSRLYDEKGEHRG